MPFLAVAGPDAPPVTPPVVVEPTTPSIPIPYVPEPAVAPVLTLTTADGTIFSLGDWSRLTATVGRKGFDSPTYAIIADESPMLDGEVFRGARPEPRDLIVPIYLRANTRAEFVASKRELLAKLAPTNGLASLEVAEGDGTRRRIGCYFTGRGAEGDTARGASGHMWTRYNLELRCPDPYWRGDPIRLEFSPPSTADFFPIWPIALQGAQTLGSTTFTNPGDVATFPVWTILGPVSGEILLRRTTPGTRERTLSLTASLNEGQWLQVDTRLDRLSITDHAGANRWPTLNDGSSLWRVNPGTCKATVSMEGAGEASRVVLDLEPRFVAV